MERTNVTKKLFPMIGISLLFSLTTQFAQAEPPKMEQGIQIGDVSGDRAIIWSRSDQSSRMIVEYATKEDFSDSKVVRGPYATPESDYTARQDLTGLPEGQTIYVKVWFEGLTNARETSEPVAGHFSTLGDNESVRFVWGGDIAGQGWGINEEFGGMKIFEAMRKVEPHFFIQSGDSVYADGPIQAEKEAEDGRIWRNIVTPEVSKVAETIDEFRGRYKYNLLDHNMRRLNAEVPSIWQWDDHEVVNNWSDSKDLESDDRYTIKDTPLLVARATQAFLEYAPLRKAGDEEQTRIYRKISVNSMLDVFVLDMRSYRGPNTNNIQTEEGPETQFFGKEQLAWLQEGLKESTATWKVIAADMPIGINVSDDYVNKPPQRWEAIANGNSGKPAGRELEVARLLSYVKANDIQNIVWLTADVHYTAAHYYDPNQAATSDFNAFWEFVAGPLNAGTFGPGTTDGTFGPQVVFNKAPEEGQANLSPFAGLQFFGEVNIDSETQVMKVALKDIDGNKLFEQDIQPVLKEPENTDDKKGFWLRFWYGLWDE